MHRSLLRQLKRSLGIADAEAYQRLLDAARQVAGQPGLDPAVRALLSQFGTLIERVEASYEQADRDQELNARSLSISSQELTEAYERLRLQLAARNRAIHTLQASVASVLGREAGGDPLPDDDIEALSRSIADLMGEREGQRQQLEQVLKFLSHEQALLDTVLCAIPDLVWLKDEAGVYLNCNTRFEQFFGAPRARIIGHTDYDFVPAAEADAFRAHDRLAIARGGASVNEEWVTFADGHRELLETTKTPIHDPEGKLLGVLGIGHDITARKSAEARLRESEQHFRTLADSGSMLIWTSDITRACNYFNAPWLRFTGRTLAEELGDGWMASIHPDDLEACVETYHGAFDRREPFRITYRLRHADGRYRWINDEGTPRHDSQGKFLGYIGYCYDITEQKCITEALNLLAGPCASLSGQAFYEAVSRHLTEALEMEQAFVGRLNPDGQSIQVMGGWHGAQPMPLFSYPLAGTPCDQVVGKQTCIYPADVQRLFPEDLHLVDGNIEAYCGAPLFDRHHQPLGLIIAFGQKPMPTDIAATKLLQVFVDRVAAEMERSTAEAALQASEQRFRNLFEQLPNISVQGYDEEQRVLYWNRASESLYGYSAAEALGRRLDTLIIPPAMAPAVCQAHRNWLDQGIPIPPGELLLQRKDGSPVPVFSSHVMLPGASGQREMYCIDVDLSDIKQAQAQLQLAASVFTHAREGITITDPDGNIIEINEAFSRITGYSRDEVLGKNPRILKSERQGPEFYAGMWRDLIDKGHWHGEIWNRNKQGREFAELLTISAVRDGAGRTLHYVALFSDITAQKQHEAQLEHIAHFDALTNLPNRVMLADRMRQAMIQVKRRQLRLAVAYIDLDGFKQVNDHHGHEVGDQLLMALSSRMQQALRQGDTIARLGGDEFVAMLIDLSDLTACTPLLNRLLAAAAQPVQLGEYTLQVSASIGVSLYPQQEEGEVDAEQLLRQADQAMYQAKLAGKNRFHIFDAERDRNLRGHHRNLQRIRQALERDEFVLHYQPKVNLRSGEVKGVEALIRWQHPEQGLLAPGLFLPDLKDHPLEVDVDAWVLETAIRQLAAWRRQGLDLPISVNISAQYLQRQDFVSRLAALLAAHPELPPGHLELEVLETSALEDIKQVSQLMKDCAALGVPFALDDFGTGYSSLTYLKRLPARVLKIDQSFVRDMLDDPEDLAILEGVLGLATAFHRQAIAEGVETVAHGRLLLQLGCEQAQGYVIARPMPATQLPGWMASWRPHPDWVHTRSVSRDDLPLLFAQVEIQAWTCALEDWLRGHGSHAPEFNLGQCRLGQWQVSDAGLRHARNPTFPAMVATHQALHVLTQTLLQGPAAPSAAALEAQLAELQGLRNELQQQLEQLLLDDRQG